eukprot:TRINITY_DN68744_c0_g1_i1.p1 TRINITY_DN68744_c0_g1~~TRINITY_DN68744_c0_g1_i1.p1  ORF type:complete len:398 (-),score=78.85 TRINITY_DN68744_c0_g1_i1:22-1215(-)
MGRSDNEERGEAAGLQYLAKPPNPTAAGRPPWPLLIFLHGAGERGHQDGRDLGKVRLNGPWTSAERFFLVAPQCPEGLVWPSFAEEVVALTKAVLQKFNLDASRCYITGLSMGAFGAWAAAAVDPSLYAAVVAVCGGFAPPLPRETGLSAVVHRAKAPPKEEEVNRVQHLPAWLFHGLADRTVDPDGSRLLFEALGGKGRGKGTLRLTTYKDGGHPIWGRAYKENGLFSWLLKHRNRESTTVSIPQEEPQSPQQAALPCQAACNSVDIVGQREPRLPPASITQLLGMSLPIEPGVHESSPIAAEAEVQAEQPNAEDDFTDGEDSEASGEGVDTDDSDAPLNQLADPKTNGGQQQASLRQRKKSLEETVLNARSLIRQHHPASSPEKKRRKQQSLAET